MRRTLETFTIASGNPAGGSPEPKPNLDIELAGEDALHAAARNAPGVGGQRASAMSFTPTGLLAHVELAR